MSIEEFVQKIEHGVEFIARFLKTAWAAPYLKEICLAIILLLAFLIIYRFIRKRFAPIKLFNNTAGVVMVTPKALNELVQSVCYSMGALNRPSVKIRVRRGRLSLTITLKLEMGQKLSEVSAAIQEEMTNALREHLGVEKLGSINVKIGGFKGILRKPAMIIQPADDDIKLEEDSSEEINDPFAPKHS